MLLKVGELAKRAGLTVRTLHHYDAIGLLTPSARSESGYRLYNAQDISRLHAIQALRQLGLPLADIGAMLAAQDTPLAQIIARQLRSLDHEIAQARELRARLALLEEALASGTPPGASDWLATLDLMATYRKYFTPAELRKIFRNWKRTQADWLPLIAAVRDALARGVAPDSLQAQQLTQRWMNLSMRWMQGDLDLARRWGKIYQLEPAANGQDGIDATLIGYMEQAIGLRMAALHRHLAPDDLQRLNKGLDQEWSALAHRAERLLQYDPNPAGDDARALLADWDALLDQTAGHDPALRAKFERAYREEPLLRMGHMITPQIRDFIDRVRAAA